MKKLFLLFACFIISISVFSQSKAPARDILMKGRFGNFCPTSVRVNMSLGNTLVTTFYEKIDNVTITVKKVNGDIVSTQTMSVEEFETFNIEIDNYAPGSYIIEIEAPEGSLEGRF
jgi:hypothetical protein